LRQFSVQSSEHYKSLLWCCIVKSENKSTCKKPTIYIFFTTITNHAKELIQIILVGTNIGMGTQEMTPLRKKTHCHTSNYVEDPYLKDHYSVAYMTTY